MTVAILLVLLALVFTVISFFESRWPLLGVAVLLLCVVVLIGSAGSVHLGLVRP